jgi:Amt family ammonium transporter
LVICVHAEDHSSGQQRGQRLVHMVGGVIGVLLTGAFASLAINAAAAAVSLTQVGKQAVLAGVTVAFSFAATLAILRITDVTIGLRVTEEHEEAGLASPQHGEVGYRI